MPFPIPDRASPARAETAAAGAAARAAAVALQPAVPRVSARGRRGRDAGRVRALKTGETQGEGMIMHIH